MEQYKNKNGKYPKSLEELFSNKMINDTIKYQKKYGFDIGANNSTWNNEADAFKHTYMQATIDLRSNEQIAKRLGDKHETQGNDRGQPSGESNMDLWNNQQGREIAKEIYKEYGPIAKILPNWPLNDVIADKVMQRMRAGKLITSPDDKRKFIDKGTTTGFAAPVETVQVFTPEQIGKMSREEFAQNESAIMSQMKDGLIQNQSPLIKFSGFINPVTGSKQIFSREDIGAMSTDEYSNNEKAINAQLNTIGVPTFSELESAVSSGGGVIYVEPYTRSNGVQVRGYYRSR